MYIFSRSKTNLYLHLSHVWNMLKNLQHAFTLHLADSTAGSGHGNPPCAGAGLLQTRFLVFVPSPHVRLHLPYGPQGLHSPFTGAVMCMKL